MSDYLARVALIQDIHLSQESSTHLPRKQSAPSSLRDIANAPALIPPDLAADFHNPAYVGGKKPSLVLNFAPTDFGFACNLGDVHIQIRRTSERDSRDSGKDFAWEAWLVKKVPSRKRTIWKKILRGNPHEFPAGAVRELCKLPMWFFYGNAWQSLYWVYKSVIFTGIREEKPNPQPKKKRTQAHRNYGSSIPDFHVTGLKSGDNLHVAGVWRWNAHKIMRVIPVANTVRFPKNRDPLWTDVSRLRLKPIRQLDQGYVPDLPGNPVYSRHAISEQITKNKGKIYSEIKLDVAIIKPPANPYLPGPPPRVPKLPDERVPDAVTLESGSRF